MRHSVAVFLVLVLAALPAAGQLDTDASVDWNHYYSNDQTNAIMRDWARRYPHLTRLYSIGRSYLGVELMLMEVASTRGPAAEERPGFYLDGNIHSSELTSSAVALRFMGHLLQAYGRDERVTKLLDTQVFYIRPKFNPDGADLALLEGRSVRSTVRPVDSDGDGRSDEDPRNDLNGDGYFTSMRIPDPKGRYRMSPEDSRIMLWGRKKGDKGPWYRVIGEGIDDDGDGKINEDGIGGLDMNRNFPRNWALEYKQRGSGPYPLSEPETHATVRFIVDHPNITGIYHGHTSGGFVYRLPSACDPATFDKHDLDLIKILGAEYTRGTGRKVVPSSKHPTRHRHGTLISWAYWDRGIIGWVPEFWPGLPGANEVERLRFNDEQLGGRYFVPWKPFEHPQLGKIEIGGWRRVWSSQNAPPELLQKECELQIPWILYLAERAPRINLDRPRVSALDNGRYAIEVTARNEGFLPTCLTKRGLLAKVVMPPIATLQLENAELLEGATRTKLGHLPGRYAYSGIDLPPTAGARWVVKPKRPGAAFRIKLSSHTAGSKTTPRIEF